MSEDNPEGSRVVNTENGINTPTEQTNVGPKPKQVTEGQKPEEVKPAIITPQEQTNVGPKPEQVNQQIVNPQLPPIKKKRHYGLIFIIIAIILGIYLFINPEILERFEDNPTINSLIQKINELQGNLQEDSKNYESADEIIETKEPEKKGTGMTEIKVTSRESDDPVKVSEETIYIIEVKNIGDNPTEELVVTFTTEKVGRLKDPLAMSPYEKIDNGVIWTPDVQLGPGRSMTFKHVYITTEVGFGKGITKAVCSNCLSDVSDTEETSIYE